jgi:hypothetical protein
MTEFTKQGYRKILITLKKAGYSFRKFSEIGYKNEPSVYLRHDIDFSLSGAQVMANLEYDEGILSTYFLQLRSPFYNPHCEFTQQAVEELNRLGHDVALHIDLNIYSDNYSSGLIKEIKLLTSYFPFAYTGIVSLHRPSHMGLNIEKLRRLHLPVPHTYENQFFEDIKYISDSTGVWRYDHPIKSEAFASRKSMQLVIHPVWWIMKGHSPTEKLGNLITERIDQSVKFLREAVSFEIHL